MIQVTMSWSTCNTLGYRTFLNVTMFPRISVGNVENGEMRIASFTVDGGIHL